MVLNEAIKQFDSSLNVSDYDVQVNYLDVEKEKLDSYILKDEDIVRLSRPFELPIQFVMGEDVH